VEVSLDSVEVLRDGATIDGFVELEVELQQGPVSDLEPVARVLEQLDGVAPARSSKLERALAASRRPAASQMAAPAKVAPPRTPGVAGDDPLPEAGRKVLRFHFDRMVAREPGTREGSDPEELHAMRVATRRLRAAWRVFGRAFRARKTRRVRRPLREVAGRLGAVRDLDVLLEAGDRYGTKLSAKERAAVKPLFDAWRKRRDEARQLLVQELDGSAYRDLLGEFRAFLADDAAARPVAANRPSLVRDTAPAAIWAAYHRVRSYDGAIGWADLDTLHALRIEAKRLRYSLEFFRETLGAEAGELISRTVELQDHLGALHDSHVAAELTREFLLERAAELEPAETDAVGRYLLRTERNVTRLRRSVGRPWQGVSGTAFRRGLGKALAAL
jgi:CHAD domain-containing protein